MDCSSVIEAACVSMWVWVGAALSVMLRSFSGQWLYLFRGVCFQVHIKMQMEKGKRVVVEMAVPRMEPKKKKKSYEKQNLNTDKINELKLYFLNTWYIWAAALFGEFPNTEGVPLSQ